MKSNSSIAAVYAEGVAVGHIFSFWDTYTYNEIVEVLRAKGDDPVPFHHEDIVACLTYEDFSAGMLLDELESLYTSAKSAIVQALGTKEDLNVKGN